MTFNLSWLRMIPMLYAANAVLHGSTEARCSEIRCEGAEELIYGSTVFIIWVRSAWFFVKEIVACRSILSARF